jgi:hypothetical protein
MPAQRTLGRRKSMTHPDAPEARPDERPLLIAIRGAYATGKTTLARKIGDALGIPVLSRDEIYGGLMATAGFPPQEPGGDASRKGVAIFYSAIRHLLESGVSLVAEQGFRRGVAEADLAPLTSISRPRITTVHAPPRRVQAKVRGEGPTRASHAQLASRLIRPRSDGLGRCRPGELPGASRVERCARSCGRDERRL